MNLDFAKVCGKHNAIFEAYYKQIDPKGSGAIEAMTAAKFLKKSGLSDVVLSRIWDLSDPNGKGFLDKPGFFVALKLVSLAQAGQVINMSNIYTETANPPKVGDLPKIMPPRIQTVPMASGGVTSGDWSIKVIDRLKYEQLFESLKPMGGMLPGNKVKGVLMDSKLPMDTLGKIWDLADQDKDGNLDKHEFIVAMHLVFQTLEKRTVPDVLPPELRKPAASGPPPKPAPPVIAGSAAPVASMPRAPSGEGFDEGGFVANFPKDIAPPPAIPPLPAAVSATQRVPTLPPPLISTDPLIPIGAPPSVVAAADWVVTATELSRYEIMFRDSDRDKDGLVSGLEVKGVFLQSGVPQNCLAHIWALCDTNQSGKLTLEQFALAMWMVERKQKGIEPPQVLTSNMVPPSLRGIITGVDLQPQADPKPAYSNPELEMISKEIEELAKERRALETEIAQKEADIRIKSGEVRSLQSELDTLSATLKQLEHQRGEAQKRLDDLKVQSTEYQEALANFNLEISQKRNQVNKIREQCQKQEETINEQEGELNSKRSELQKLKDEEAALQKEYEENNRELQNLTKHLQNTQLQISSVRSMVTQLLETQRQMTDALLMCRAAIESNDTEIVSEYQLKIEPDFDEARKTLEKKIEIKPDPFEDNSIALKGTNGFTSNGFASDPFTANTAGTTTTITRTGFDDSFNTSSVGGFGDTGFDAFGSSGGFGQQKDPFGGDAFAGTKASAITPEPGKDDFGSDPFAALHAPTGQGQVLSPNTQKSGPPPRPESPSPALPPKKSKVPPPRPAPPRPLQAPARPAQPAMDAFGAPVNSSGFTDFADFDNKQLPIIPPPLPSSTTTITRKTPSPLSFHTLSSALAFSSNTSSLLNATATSASTTSSQHSATTTSTAPNSSNINLNRSNTPLQQAVTINNTTKPSTSLGNKATSKQPVIYGPTDFSDDPFKDYRYEDPFNIKDPFADDDLNSGENVFKDDLSTDDDDDHIKRKDDLQKHVDTANTSMNSNSTSATSQTFNSAKSTTPTGNDFLDRFDAFNINPSPVPSIQSTTSGAAASGSIEGTTTASSVKSQRNTPIFSSASGNVFDNFADFDAFSSKSTKSSNNSTFEPLTADSKNHNNNNNNNAMTTTSSEVNDAKNDSFFDAFNDNFLDNSNVGTSRQFSSNQNILDAFGGASCGGKETLDAFGSTTNIGSIASNDFDAFVTKSEKVFDNFNENGFEDDFFKDAKAMTVMQSKADVNFNITANSTNKNTDKKATAINENFAEFDAFDDANFSTVLNNSKNLSDSSNSGAAFSIDQLNCEKLNKVQNNTTPLSKMQNNTAGAKLPSKFAADYSNTESFDNDLEEAIKRSMVEK